jgi:hypothetical protein
MEKESDPGPLGHDGRWRAQQKCRTKPHVPDQWFTTSLLDQASKNPKS